MVMYYRALYAASDPPVCYLGGDSLLQGGSYAPECLWIRWSDPYREPGQQPTFRPHHGEVKTVIPTAENMSAVFGKDGVETEIQVGQMRQTLGKPGLDWLFNKR